VARVAIVQDIYWEYLGVMYISSVLKRAGHQVEVFIERSDKDLIKGLLDFAPDITAFPVTTGMHVRAVETARAIKKSIDTKIVFGAYHPTFFPEIINEDYVDVICRGEAEEAMLELADRLDRNEDLSVLNCWVKDGKGVIKKDVRPLTADLDSLPFPDRKLYIAKYPFMKTSQAHVIAGRGCPFSCSFCFNHAFRRLYKDKGEAFRLRSVSNVIEEIKEIKVRLAPKSIYMQDDTFALDKNWVLDFLDSYVSLVQLPFVCMIRADSVDEELIKRLKEAGCSSVFFGVETGSEDLRNSLLNKKITDAEILETAALLKKYGLRFRTFNMFNLPGESLKDAYKTVELNQRIRTDFPWSSLYYPYPGTELADHALKSGLIKDAASKVQPSFFKAGVISSPHKNRLMNLQKLFFYAVKFPRLFPLLKKIIAIRPNIFFDLAFLAGYAYNLISSEGLSFGDTLRIGRRNMGRFFFNR
jgi:anaerobic magnesium-protoporphyrin IX monomethyl ester cyclase